MEIFIASMIALTAVMIYACILSAKLEKRLVEAQKERRKMQTRIINDRRYARDKPSDCAYCYFWKAKKNAAARQSVITCFLLKIRIHHHKPQIHPGPENPETAKPAHTAGIRHASATV